MCFPFSLGESVLSAEHRASPHHQAQGDPSSRVESLHEGRASHSHPGAAVGNSVCPASLQTWRTGFFWNLRLHHAHTDALPSEWWLWCTFIPVRITFSYFKVTFCFLYRCLPIFLCKWTVSWSPAPLSLFRLVKIEHSSKSRRWSCLCYSPVRSSRKEDMNYRSWRGLNSVGCWRGVIWSSWALPARPELGK